MKLGQDKINAILSDIENYHINKVFEQIDNLGISDAMYARLKQEFIVGKTDVDYVDRLKLWVRSQLPKIELPTNETEDNPMVITKSISVPPVDGEDFGFIQTIVKNDGVFKLQETQFKPKKILFVCSSPNDKNPLDFGKEFKKIKMALQNSEKREHFEIMIETGVEADDFLRLITKHQPDFLHITMHASKSKGLYFEGNQGEEQAISPEELAEIFALIYKKYIPELVVLSACNSLSQAESIRSYTNHVIGMQDFLPEDAGIIYAEKLYEMLFDGESIDYAHHAAKLGIKMAKLDYQGVVSTHEIPVLLSKSANLIPSLN